MFRSIAATLSILALIAAPAICADDEAALIKQAAPNKPIVKPEKPRKLLVFTLTRGFYHDVIPTATLALQIMGEKTGAFEVTQTDDISFFEPDKLKQFDAVCFQNTTGEVFTPADFDKLSPDDQAKAVERRHRLRQSLFDFVTSGKGLVGVHAATDTLYTWPVYGSMMGGYFNGHPWNEDVVIKLDEPDHPLNAAFKGQPLRVADEIYQFRAPYSRKHQRVLLSLDTSQTDMKKQGINRDDDDFAVSWIQQVGAGRIFYCSLGHRHDIFWNPQILAHYLAGIQYACGDLKVPGTTPEKQPDAGWLPLFDGQNLNGWICSEGSWAVEDGVMTRKGGGDIWTELQFADFTLELDFKVSAEANSGVFFRTGDLNDCVQTGIEMQVYDSFGKETPTREDCGAIFDCLAPSKNAVKQAGEWNHTALTCRGSKINIVLNGEPIIDMNLDDWTTAHKNPDGTDNKFNTAYKDMPRKGYIGFQDHGHDVWYRNVRIKPLAD
ncbi:MAG: DUF1080 domain-containing protein [Phycisphaerae bacterium]|nr:DUF1080 domain-containing protein [Phycisphaerae bacterium]